MDERSRNMRRPPTEKACDATLSPPAYRGDEDANILAARPTPMTQGSEHNRGRRATQGSGVVEGSGAGAGGGGNPEDYDSDPVAGATAQQAETTADNPAADGGDEGDVHEGGGREIARLQKDQPVRNGTQP
jgi:hypothetical protein